jgi:1-deoxyxylulose-5-phosphate synthase
VEYRTLGRSGLRVSAIGLGCNPFGLEVDAAGARRIVDAALELGVTYFDTADAYHDGRSEEHLGQALVGRRSQVVVATKFGLQGGGSRIHVMRACEQSLRRLRTDYIDVYQMHHPDRSTPIEETLRALDDLVRQGKVRAIGSSNALAWEVADAQWTARSQGLTPFACCQEFYNLLYRSLERQMLPFLVQHGLGLIPYFPLAGGLLSGTYRRGIPPAPGTRGSLRPTFARWDTERNWRVQERLAEFAADRGWSLPGLAVAWLLTRPQLATVIAGADVPEHLAGNVGALDIQLSQADLAEIDRLTLVDEDRSVPPVTSPPRGGPAGLAAPGPRVAGRTTAERSGRRVLVVGGSGFLGRRIVEQFLAAGDEVSVLSRGQAELPSGVRHLAADRRQPQALTAALRGQSFDVVVDNVAFDGADVIGLLTALDGRLGHCLLTSSSAVYADRYIRRPLREAEADLSVRLAADAPGAFHPRLGQAYGNGKREAEAALRDSGVAWTALRAPIVVGGDDRTLRIWWFVQRLLDGGPLLIPDWGPGRLFQVVWARDFARACLLAAGTSAARGRAYNVAQAEVFTAETWIQALASALGRPATCASITEDQLNGLGLAGYAMPIAGRPFGHVLLDLAAAEHDLGFVPVAESEWLVETAQMCAAEPPAQASRDYERRAIELRVTAEARHRVGARGETP